MTTPSCLGETRTIELGAAAAALMERDASWCRTAQRLVKAWRHALRRFLAMPTDDARARLVTRAVECRCAVMTYHEAKAMLVALRAE